MLFTFTLMDERVARIILSWQYESPYTTYSMAEHEETLAEMLDRRSPYYAVWDEQKELIGFFCFGTASLMTNSERPAIYVEENVVSLGLGMRPDLTGKGLGQRFVEAGLNFARQTFAPESFVLYVYLWNERAIKVYERVGFRRGKVSIQKNQFGESEFVEMRKAV